MPIKKLTLSLYEASFGKTVFETVHLTTTCEMYDDWSTTNTHVDPEVEREHCSRAITRLERQASGITELLMAEAASKEEFELKELVGLLHSKAHKIVEALDLFLQNAYVMHLSVTTTDDDTAGMTFTQRSKGDRF